jgi:hypothetical protein
LGKYYVLLGKTHSFSGKDAGFLGKNYLNLGNGYFVLGKDYLKNGKCYCYYCLTPRGFGGFDGYFFSQYLISDGVLKMCRFLRLLDTFCLVANNETKHSK